MMGGNDIVILVLRFWIIRDLLLKVYTNKLLEALFCGTSKSLVGFKIVLARLFIAG